ncbi:MAG TPA: alpha/beta fold hydrolase [Pseudonocardiaceae bacterium]|nr:alpha/beta fold hydrolase [Pseudonocardiaceae bacterium]
MPRSLRVGRVRARWLIVGLIAVLAVVGIAIGVHAAGQPAVVRAQNLFIPVVDGPAHDQHVRLDATVYYPERTPAPAVLIAPGFGGTKSSVADQARELAQQGFVALAYTPRGFGASGGLIGLNSPDYEIADGRQLIDWLARQPQVTKDGPNDPKVGVTGGSYGGALSLMLAGSDRRVDAIAPVITYNDLSQALVPNTAAADVTAPGTPAAGAFAPNGVFKRTWAGIFFGAGLGGPGITPQTDAPTPGAPTTSSDGTTTTDTPAAPPDPSGATTAGVSGACGRFLPEVCAAYQQIATTGQADARTIALLRRDSPVSVTGNIKVPTLLVQGEQDTLFGLDQADANARQITAAGGLVKVIWYDGGHDGGAPGPDLRQQIGDWFQHYLRGQGGAPGTAFQYDVQGGFRTAAPSVRTVTAPEYPGLTGTTTQRRSITLSGPAQPVVNPPGGSPAAVSGLPGLGGALSGRLTSDVPGEFAAFTSGPVSSQLLVAGSSTVRLRVAAVPGQDPNGQAVLFAKLYDIGPNGTRTLPGAGVAPIRLDPLPGNGSPVDVTVTLPGIVQPVQAGHRLQLVVSTTDQSYANLIGPAVLRISLADAAIAVPVVPGTEGTTGLPVGQLVAIAVVLALCLLAGVVLLLRRRRRDDVDADTADVPLVLSGLSKSYPGGVVAVDDLSFRVEQGQVVGLLGPNGAGKTTALRMMMGLVRPTGGSIRVFGHKIRPGAPVLSRIGSFVEGSGFLPHLSGIANLHLYWAATGRPTADARFDEALEIAGLGTAVRRKVGTYSQGMRQRLAIAQAMLGLPDLLVLDEPTNGLDPPQIRDMREVLRGYAAGGRTVLVSSHLLTEVEQTCDHVVVMHKGRLVAAGAVAEIVGGGGETSFRVDDVPRAMTVLGELPGLADVPSASGDEVHARLNGLPRSAAVDALVRAGVAVDQVGPRRRLEDAFLQLVGGD